MASLRLATRTSALAMVQTREVAALLQRAGHAVEIVGVTTRGDKFTDRGIAAIGGDGAFTKELEAAVLDGRADAAVHSMKDLPTDLAPGLCIGAVLAREDARDLLVSARRSYAGFAALPSGAMVGTSSLRRRAAIRIARPDVSVCDLRGNVDTRIRKVIDGQVDAAVLALAGVKRIGLLEMAQSVPLSVDEMVPAVGQGAICAECRADDIGTREALGPLEHRESSLAIAMERAFLQRCGGGCLVPIGAHATVDGRSWSFVAMIASADGSAHMRRTASGTFDREALAVAAAESIADEMLDGGGGAIVASFRSTMARRD